MAIKKSQIVVELRANGYNQKFIDKTRQKMWKKEEKGEHLNEKKPRLVIPYKQGQTEKLRRVLSSKFQVAIKPINTIKQQLCHQKDPIPFSQQSGVLYCYQCADCPEQYIGEMKLGGP